MPYMELSYTFRRTKIKIKVIEMIGQIINQFRRLVKNKETIFSFDQEDHENVLAKK